MRRRERQGERERRESERVEEKGGRTTLERRVWRCGRTPVPRVSRPNEEKENYPPPPPAGTLCFTFYTRLM
eukprot:scaffold248975_cov23-Tisochrysis_lutea.AAC.1